MENNSKPSARSAGIGTGYLSIMMIFVVLCLTMLAALSFSAAESEKNFSDRSAEYTADYYAADLNSKRTLAQIEAIAAGYSDYSDFMFLSELDSIDGIEYATVRGGIEISWVTEINERQNIYSKIRISDSGTEILCRQTVLGVTPEETPLNVWDGE